MEINNLTIEGMIEAYESDLLRLNYDRLDLLKACELVASSLSIKSFQKGGVSYGGDKWTISHEAADAVRDALLAVKERDHHEKES